MRTQSSEDMSPVTAAFNGAKCRNLKFYDFLYVFHKPDLNHAVGNLNRSAVQSNRPNMPGCTALGH